MKAKKGIDGEMEKWEESEVRLESFGEDDGWGEKSDEQRKWWRRERKWWSDSEDKDGGGGSIKWIIICGWEGVID